MFLCYYYKVTAVDSDDNESDYTSEVSTIVGPFDIVFILDNTSKICPFL